MRDVVERNVGLPVAWAQAAGEKSADEQFRDAISVLTGQYQREIDAICEDLVSRVVSREITSRDDFDTAIHETIDGHHDVIYTQSAQVVVLVSGNDGAGIENYGADGIVQDGAINWSALAYSAMEADVRDRLPSAGPDWFDVNDDESFSGTDGYVLVEKETGRIVGAEDEWEELEIAYRACHGTGVDWRRFEVREVNDVPTRMWTEINDDDSFHEFARYLGEVVDRDGGEG
jgi:hypothetical protein